MVGIFMTVEGPDGSGKSTLIRNLAPVLQTHCKQPIMLTREPGGSVIAEKIRDVILDPMHTQMDVKTEALLFAAARRQHLVEKVLPALEQEKLVICDRFVDSSIVYQGIARDIGVDGVRAINAFATDNKRPDITLYLDIDAKTGLERIHNNRVDEINRLDNEGQALHEKVVEGYQILIKQEPHRFIVLDAKQSPDALVQEAFIKIVEKLPELFN